MGQKCGSRTCCRSWHCAADRKIDIRYSIALLIERLVGLCIHALGIAEDNFQLTIIAFGVKLGYLETKKSTAVISGGMGGFDLAGNAENAEIQKMIVIVFGLDLQIGLNCLGSLAIDARYCQQFFNAGVPDSVEIARSRSSMPCAVKATPGTSSRPGFASRRRSFL